MTKKNDPTITDTYHTSFKKVPAITKLTHELKNQIHGMKGVSTYLLSNWEQLGDDAKIKCLGSITDASNRASCILETMLKSVAGQEKLQLNFLYTDLLNTVKLSIKESKNLHLDKKDFDIIFESNLETCFVNIDEFWITQLIINLLSNAASYSNDKSILVTIKKENLKNNDYAVVSVIDHGDGIAENELEAIFDPFYSSPTNKSVSSTGLGLTICREIVEAHHGEIFAFNNQDKGFTIKFIIPI